ncbi:MAG: PQQ-binding-like beta-propeller repeat protein [Epsilonproteobacteria bacterium]|nr:PQQ-binding-like beta-propeller repeat protein [Campylobacterota bacterium]
MKFSLIALSLVWLVLLSGCSHKEVYKPENIKGEWRNAGHLSASIAQSTSSAALLEDRTVLTKEGEKKIKIPQEYRLINADENWVISESPEGNLVLFPSNGTDRKITLELKRGVAAASVQNDTIAVLFVNNEMALYSLESKKLVFKESGNAPIAVDARIANPYFLKELVLFLTLDGKIVIVNSETKQVLRSVVVSSAELFNNITYMNVIDNHLVASTGSGVLALSQKESREKYEIRNIAYTAEGIWLTTKQGEIIALDPTLQFKAKKKFPFAHFVGLSVQSDRIYVLEQGGYMIALTKNLLSYDIYDVDMDSDSKIFVGDGRFYFDDRYINIK